MPRSAPLPEAEADQSPGPLGAALVVEDDPLVAMHAVESLRTLGAGPIACCATVEEAREAMEQRLPAIVVLDVRLGERRDGWVFAELIGALGPAQPRLIFATGAPESIPAEVAALGTVVSKPYGREDLARALEPHRSGLLSRLKGAISGEQGRLS